MSRYVTRDLVEQVAIIAYENVRVRNAVVPLPSWTGLSPIDRYKQKLQVAEVMTMVIPVLIEQGWTPPTQEPEPWQYFAGADDEHA